MLPEEPTTGDYPAQRKAAKLEKPRFPLVFKLFLLTALLIVIVVSIAVGITIQYAGRISRATVDKSISGAAKLFKDLEKQRLGRLALGAQLLGGDPSFAAYIERALTSDAPPAIDPSAPPVTPAPNSTSAPPPVIDVVSILDQLVQRKEQLGSDLVMLLDDQGLLVARSDQPAVSAQQRVDLYEASPLVKTIVDDASIETSPGVLSLGDVLYHAVVAPIAVGQNRVRIGYIINAYAIDDTFANKIAESTNAGVMFLAAPRGSSAPSIARSSDAPSLGMKQLGGLDPIFRSGKSMPPSDLVVDRSSYVMTGEPLVSGKDAVGAALFLRSLDRELAPFRQIENALLAGGGGALLLAFILSWLIAKRVTRPIEELAGMAQSVTAGDYDVQPNMDRNDEVGILGRSFAKMITSLRDKAELEELFAQMAAKSAEREAAAPARVSEPPKLEEGTILVTDIRGLPPTASEAEAPEVIGSVSRVMKLQEAEVNRQDGSVREIAGHRLLSVFHGPRGVIHAIRAARAIHEEVASNTEMQGLSVGVGIASGDFVTGSIDLRDDSGLAIVGNAPTQAILFAEQAPSGYAYVAQDAAQDAGGEVSASSTAEEIQLRWMAEPVAVAAFPLAALTTGMMQAIGGTAQMATMRVGTATVAGQTSPQGQIRDLTIGETFAGRYRIDQVLGRGGMGVVYRASDTQLDETVAIKTLPGDVMQRSPEELERFKREIRLARRITHRNVLRTFDYGEAQGVYFISMEFVRGYTLSELVAEAPNRQMAPRVAVGVARQICRGLQAAHEQGIIHRDIKPQNVLIDAKGEVKLMDFGIARMAETNEAMTQAGLIVGTPHYMSPEQVQGKQLDPRSDVYAMGVLMYEMLAGKLPFESSSLTGILTAHLMEKPRPLIEVRPEVGRELNAVIMRCLAKDTKERYADAGEMLTDLDRIQVPTLAAA